MKRKDVILIAVVLLAALGIFYFSRGGLPQAVTPLSPAAEAPVPQASDAQGEQTAQPIRPAQSFLHIQVGSKTHSIVPLNHDEIIEVKQPNGAVNRIEISNNRAKMHFSTCKNQECLHQGEMRLDNIMQRPLFNQIVCLPNQVLLELLTPEEAQVKAGLAP